MNSFIQTISIAPLQVNYYSEALPTQHEYTYCAGVSRRSATGNCELRTCPRPLRGAYDPSDESCQLNQYATHPTWIVSSMQLLLGKLFYYSSSYFNNVFLFFSR